MFEQHTITPLRVFSKFGAFFIVGLEWPTIFIRPARDEMFIVIHLQRTVAFQRARCVTCRS
jgi:hypothetical protein